MPITDPKIIARADELFLARTYLEEESAVKPVLSFFALYHYVMADGQLTVDQQNELANNPRLKEDFQALWLQKAQPANDVIMGFAAPAAAASTGTGHQEEPKIPLKDQKDNIFATLQLADRGDGRRMYLYIQFENAPYDYNTLYFKSTGYDLPPRKLLDHELPDEQGHAKITLLLRDEEDKRLIDLLRNEGIQMGAERT